MLNFKLRGLVMGATGFISAHIANIEGITSCELSGAVEQPCARLSTALSGTVVDSASLPLANADVTIPSLNLRARTNAQGEYRIAEISAGIHSVIVRRVGYRAVTASIVFVDNEVEVRRFVLQRIVELDSISVTSKKLDANMTDFEDHMRMGIGTFLTREKLAKFDGHSLARVLSQIPGVHVARGSGNRTWIANTRFAGGLGGEGKRILATSDKASGATQLCYAKIYVDNVLWYGGSDYEPLFDASSLDVNLIEGIEYYSGAAQTPARYAGLGAGCGVMIIWTRKVK